jgi:hypothetical protein
MTATVISPLASPWIPLEPKLRQSGRGWQTFFSFVLRLASPTARLPLEQARTETLRQADDCGAERLIVRVLVSVLGDLRAKGWQFRIEDGSPYIAPPEEGSGTVAEQKDRVRSSLLQERDAQLMTPAVRSFVSGMEQRRLGHQGWTSVFSVMRDGRELDSRLREIRQMPEGPDRLARLRGVIDPYIQFVDGEAVCDQTGLRLADFWRYFRQTWATPYNNAPGRKFFILVRDRAVKHHPVIGIAAFGNAVVQLGPRDEWIGWTAKPFIARLKEEASRDWACWLQKSADSMADEVYHDDFLQEKVVTQKELMEPTDEAIGRLEELANAERKKHDLSPQSDTHKFDEDGGDDEDWLARAKTHLFRAKRAEALARVLQVRKGLRKAGFTEPIKDALLKVLDDAAGRRAVEIVLRQVKAARIGINMLEITICGAVAPYNALLGGKLVAMLLTSPEVAVEYERRYKNACSVIASSTAGRAVKRKPNLVLLGTTSLYGVGSAMYNRLSIPAEAVGGTAGEAVRYEELGKSVGFGSIQFSTGTINEIEAIIGATAGGRQINHIFGEGVSPRLRKMRSGMEAVGLPPDKLLQHGSQRIVYGVSLAAQFQDVMQGRRTYKPKYIFPFDNPEAVTSKIADYWIARWLNMRISRDESLADVEAQTLVYPVTHGARVRLPPLPEEGLTLFDLLDESR